MAKNPELRCNKTVNFELDDPYEKKLLDFASQNPRFSVYVKRLIQRDMEGGYSSPPVPMEPAPTVKTEKVIKASVASTFL